MTQNELPDTMKLRDFRIIGDAATKYRPLDAITQFKYKGYLISISTAGLSAGACSTEIGVFEGDVGVQLAWCPTVQDAIEWVDKRLADIARTNYSTEPPLGNNRQWKLLELAKERDDSYAVQYVRTEIINILLELKNSFPQMQYIIDNITHAQNFDEEYAFSGFTTQSFYVFHRIEHKVYVVSTLFVQLEILLTNLGVEIPDA